VIVVIATTAAEVPTVKARLRELYVPDARVDSASDVRRLVLACASASGMSRVSGRRPSSALSTTGRRRRTP
jgi:hypothetical protein